MSTQNGARRADSPRAVQEILEHRARVLARPLQQVAAVGSGIDVLTFVIARERLAIESRYVAGVFRLSHLTPLPGAERPVRGLTSWRGEVVTVLDIRPFVGATTTALDDLAHVVVIDGGRHRFGILTDEVGTMGSLAHDDILPFTDVGGERRAGSRDFVRGVTRNAVLLLDATRLIAVVE